MPCVEVMICFCFIACFILTCCLLVLLSDQPISGGLIRDSNRSTLLAFVKSQQAEGKPQVSNDEYEGVCDSDGDAGGRTATKCSCSAIATIVHSHVI